MSAKLHPFERQSARKHADEVITQCLHDAEGPVDALDAASQRAVCWAACPESFTPAQREYVHARVLKRFLAAIGRC